MDSRIRELERRSHAGDINAARRLVMELYRLWDSGHSLTWLDFSVEVPDPESEYYILEQKLGRGPALVAEIEKRIEHGRNFSFEALRGALHQLGMMTIEPFVHNLNFELSKTGIPFNPIGIAATYGLESHGVNYWWASLKERFSLEPEITMFGEPECAPEEHGQVPGFQVHYGTGFEYKLYLDGRKTVEIWDTTTGAKVKKWLGRGDAEESHRLSQLYGYYGGDATPASWVDRDEYLERRARLKQEIVDAVYRADPEIEVIEKRGHGTAPRIIPPSWE